MAGSLPLKNDVQPVTQFPQSRRQVHDVLSAAESVPPISDSEVTCGPMTRPATLSSSATSSSNSTDFSSSSSTVVFFSVSGFSKIQIAWFYLSGTGCPAHQSSPGQRAVKRLCILCFFSVVISLFCAVPKVRMSSLFIRGYLTRLEFSVGPNTERKSPTLQCAVHVTKTREKNIKVFGQR